MKSQSFTARIGGRDYTLSAQDDPERLKHIADYLDRKIGEASMHTAMNGEIADNQREYAKAVADASGEIEAAKREWRSAIDEVKKRAAESAAATEAAKAKSGAAADATKKAGATLSGLSDGGKSVGAWSAQELDALLGGSHLPAEAGRRSVDAERVGHIFDADVCDLMCHDGVLSCFPENETLPFRRSDRKISVFFAVYNISPLAFFGNGRYYHLL